MASTCFGMVLYNHEKHLRQALDALLAQTCQDFRIVAVDDCSSDHTADIMQEYAAVDQRISFYRNETRLGMVDNKRRAFELACQEPLDFYAWVSDHDVHQPRWLEVLRAVLLKNPEVLMAYPLARRIDDDGNDLHVPSPRLDTTGLSPQQRFRRLYAAEKGFGNMIYGLYRAAALREAGIFRHVLTPDTVLIWELSLRGTICQVDEELWLRRYVGAASKKRQKKSLFRSAPLYIHLPPVLVNTTVLLWNTALKPSAGNLTQRSMGFNAAAGYFLRGTRSILTNIKQVIIRP